MGTASCEGQGVVTECRVDRFSDLPDGVAHHIVSFLKLRDLIRLGSLSQRCRELYLSPPSLNLVLSEEDTSTCAEWSRFLDSVDGFLHLRGDKKMRKFYICWGFDHERHETPCACDDKKFRIIPWIKNALRCKVEVMNLRINSVNVKTPFEFPSCIFLCGSLRSLWVKMLDGIIKTPSFACLSNLEYLSLTYVAIDEGLFKWISSSCKCIKELRLDRVCGVQDITIQSTSLKSFSIWNLESEELLHLKISGEKLEDIHIQWGFYTRHSRSLNLFAPNLKYLEWTGNTVNHHMGKLLHLEKANICLRSLEDLDDDCMVLDLLRSIHKVKALTLQQATIMALFKKGSISVPSLHDVSYLRIDIGCFSDEIVRELVSLFRGMPNLSTLHINIYGSRFVNTKIDCSGLDSGYWNLQDLPFISQLSEVTIELSEDSHGSNPIKFSSFILKRAKNLKKMVIVHSTGLAKRLQKLSRSKKSSNAEVIFHRERKF